MKPPHGGPVVGAILNIYFIQFILCLVSDARKSHDLDKKEAKM